LGHARFRPEFVTPTLAVQGRVPGR